MSQISRRNFMKCAGAAALAIAASGILTGCDNTLDVEVTFVYNGQDPASAAAPARWSPVSSTWTLRPSCFPQNIRNSTRSAPGKK